MINVDDRPLSAFYGQPLTDNVHHESARLEPGYVTADLGASDPFYRAIDAKKHASHRVEWLAERIAEAVAGGYLDTMYDREAEVADYQRAKAGRSYADAVYEVEAAKVRAA